MSVFSIDPGARQRLTARFGSGVEAWFDDLPRVLAVLAREWRFDMGSPIPRGSVSVVFRCRLEDGRGGVLKLSPDRARLALEAAALEGWATARTPAVLALDEGRGALLLEAIEPGTALASSSTYPSTKSVADLLTSLHATAVSDRAFPAVAQRVAYLFESSTKLYEARPEIAGLVPPELYERGRRFATELADEASPPVLLHGDLTPSNILDGGDERGLVAIDPAPCIGDGAFDAVDLILWRADDIATVKGRCERVAAASGLDSKRLLAWCVAFAAMTALELGSQADDTTARIAPLLELAARAAPLGARRLPRRASGSAGGSPGPARPGPLP